MDYRFYRGPGLEFPPVVIKHLHLLRYIGLMMMVSFPVFGLLLLLNILELSFFWFFIFLLVGGFGSVFFIIGIAYNSIGDRGTTRSLIWKIQHLGKAEDAKVYRPGRKMIYDHYEVPVSSGNVKQKDEWEYGD